MSARVREVDLEWLRRKWKDSDWTIERMAAYAGVSGSHIGRLARRNNFPQRESAPRRYNEKCQQRLPDPTPEEIEQRCAEVRARRVNSGDEGGWTAPEFGFDHKNFRFT
jgi:hypothetical protein